MSYQLIPRWSKITLPLMSERRANRVLMPLEEAWLRITEVAQAHRIAKTQQVATFDALHRVLAEDVISGITVPPADNTSMDGYAVRSGDITQAGARLRVTQRIAAGQVGHALEPGTAARIFTGAPIPPGADAVIMQERCTPVSDEEVRIDEVPTPGQWIRRQGEDIEMGRIVLAQGARLTPQALGLAASVGQSSLRVLRQPRVSLFSTGDELVMPGEPLREGAIYNSNRFTLKALLQALGCEVRDLGIVPDRLEATCEALREAARDSDLIVTSGGVSVGEEDHLRPAVNRLGQLDLWQIAIKPGKPLAFGRISRPQDSDCLYIGMPGNPVSSFMTALLFVEPVLRSLQGMLLTSPKRVALRADFDWLQPDKRREFLRVRLNGQGGLDLFGNQSSGVLTSVAWADGVVDNPPGEVIRRGDRVNFIDFNDWIYR